MSRHDLGTKRFMKLPKVIQAPTHKKQRNLKVVSMLSKEKTTSLTNKGMKEKINRNKIRPIT
jgi:hypothetical protein